MKTTLTERDLDGLSEPTRSTAFELSWLLRESGHSEDLAIRLAFRAAYEGQAARLADASSEGGGAPARTPP